MKVIKNMKKLKFWSRKKKKKRINFLENPPTNCQCCCQNHQFQPSAPPLPPYYEQTHDANFAFDVNYHTFSEFPTTTSSEWQFASTSQQNDIAPEMKPLLTTLPVSSTSAYQQYMVKAPVYGMPVVPMTRRERSAGVFGCVVSAGAYLIRFACPCFHIKEAY